MKIFCSGSCRLLHAMTDTDKIEVIHNLREPYFEGNNFISKLHDTKSHIQFINFIKGSISLDKEILKRCYTSYNIDRWQKLRIFEFGPIDMISKKIENLKNNIDTCNIYIFEICSIKLYKYKGFFCQCEQIFDNDVSDYEIITQSEEDLLNDLETLISFFPNKKFIFQSHFRPNIIYNDQSKEIDNRELIYNTLVKFCKTHINCQVYDPSLLLQANKSLFDGDIHFTYTGYDATFQRICNEYLNI